MDDIANFSGDLNSSFINSTTSFNTSIEVIYSVGTAAHTVNVVITILTTLLNGIIIRYLLKYRSKFPEVIIQQTLCLSVTDFIAGLMPSITCLTMVERFDRMTWTCITIFSTSSVAHLAVLINLCFLSVRRWIVLRNASKPNTRARQRTSTSRTVVYIICPWIVASLAYAPVVRQAILQGTTPINGCLSPSIFDDSESVLPYLAFNIISLLLLTLFYIRSMIALKRIETPSVNNEQGRRQRLQAKAFKHLLTVLIVANIATLPSVVLIVLAIMNIVRDSQIMFIGNRLQMMNSAINPILYSIHITEMRNVIGESVTQMLDGVRACCGFNGNVDIHNRPTGDNENHRF